jgi:hypothetical protein
MTTHQPGDPHYQPVEGDSVAMHSGPRELNHNIGVGVWRLLVGDKPVIGMRRRGDRGTYALPAFIEGTTIAGVLRLSARIGEQTRPLESFETIDAMLSPGGARWRCIDGAMGLTVDLAVQHIDEVFGYAVTMSIESTADCDAAIQWRLSDVQFVESVNQNIAGVAEHRHDRFTRIFTGLVNEPAKIENGAIVQPLVVKAGRKHSSRFLCVWGYSDYDHQSVADAYQRLEYRPFPVPGWVEAMKKKWFEHWIGRGLNPRDKFDAARADFDGLLARARAFWNRQRKRVIVKTPDLPFDTAVRNTAGVVTSQYEYPCFMHGTDWTKYGKINCGFYGLESAGFQNEVADSLMFLTGTQDIKGRQRYFSPAFALSIWCEEQDFYFVEQVWHHYRWTGDAQFVKDLWPSVRIAMEHGLEASDPDGDGMMTAYYETWNCDTHARGGKCALWTGMAAAALRAAAKMAQIVDDKGIDGYALDRGAHQQANNLRTPQERYERLARRSEAALATLWNAKIGFYASAEWDDTLHPRPSAMESNYIAWRGAGDAIQKYLISRFIRDNYHISKAPGVVQELINDAWPILWSHHYVANGDSCISILCAALANDVDAYWPSLQTICNTLYTSDSATLRHTTLEDGTGCGMQQLIEMEPQLLQAVIDGLFGIAPDLGENLLTIRPALPGHWPAASIAIEQVRYEWERSESAVKLSAATPVDRRLRVELPVAGAVRSVMLNGRPVAYTTRPEVNCCRVIVDAPAGREFIIEIKTGDPVMVGGPLSINPGEKVQYTVQGAMFEGIVDPQSALTNQSISADGKIATITAGQVGRPTVLLALRAGEAAWWHPLELNVKKPLEIVTTLIAGPGSPAVASPAVDVAAGKVSVQVRNNTDRPLQTTATIGGGAGGENSLVTLDLSAGHLQTVSVALDAHDYSPGATPLTLYADGLTDTADAVSWAPPVDLAAFQSRLRPIDLTGLYNQKFDKLYHPSFQWRHDYTGCGVGVDWRDPMPPKDDRGYLLMTSPVAQFEYQSLPEGWVCQTYWEVPLLPSVFETSAGVRFRTGPEGNNVLALACTQPYEQLPSEVRITLPQPTHAEKLYLLTGNLTKTVKCYYPGAEIVIDYSDGTRQLHSLIPPHSMPVMAQHICPRALHVSWGIIHGDPVPLFLGGNEPNLAVTDVPLDRSKSVLTLSFRCVASETILGIVGLTLLAPTDGHEGNS